MTYIPEAYIITRSEKDHIRNTLEDAQMFYEQFYSKPSDINNDLMEWRLKDCEEAQHIVRNLESDETQYRPSTKEVNPAIHTKTNYYGQEISIGDTDYFD